MSEQAASQSKPSIKTQTFAAAAAIVGAVAVPQVFHLLGAASGLGTSLGEIFLPMHLPILLVGLLAGPYAGAAAGLLGPLASFLMTGMPGSAMLPFMMLELFGYGFFAGLLRNAKMPLIVKVIIAQLGGRVVRAAAVVIAVYALENTAVGVASIWKTVVTGLFGLALQWILIPLIVYRVEHKAE